MKQNEEDGFGLQAPPLPKRKKFVDIQGNFIPMVAVSLAVALLVVLGIGMFGGGTLATKADLVGNMTNMTASVDAIQTGLVGTKQEVAVALQGIPGSIVTQVSSGVAQATSQWSSQLSSLSDKVTVLEGKYQTQGNSITALVSKDTTLEASVAELKATIDAYNSKVGELERDVYTLSKQVSLLQSQYYLSNVIINSVAVSYSLANGISQLMPLSISNTGNTNMSVPVKLTLTTSSLGIVVGSAFMNAGMPNVSANGSTVVFSMTIDVPALSTLVINPSVTLNYTGSSPNTWMATWSKQ